MSYRFVLMRFNLLLIVFAHILNNTELLCLNLAGTHQLHPEPGARNRSLTKRKPSVAVFLIDW